MMKGFVIDTYCKVLEHCFHWLNMKNALIYGNLKYRIFRKKILCANLFIPT
ncbi:hypothetical protein IX324_002988 [Bacteroides pyogenes]|nr:hypothetical protein [Bacteroides pyogenes]